MSLRVEYSPLMLARAAEIDADVRANCGEWTKTNREEYCNAKYNISYDYIRNIGGCFKHPSMRVLRNMGLELWVRDPRTGQSERVDVGVLYDWNPRNPRISYPQTSPSSTSTSLEEPQE